MLHQHTLDQLRSLRLDGMIAALNDDAIRTASEALPFEQRLALLVQRELDWRDGKRVARLLKNAKLKVGSACIEDIDWRGGRGLDRPLVTTLAEGDWIRHGRNVLITGATGCGKSRRTTVWSVAGPPSGCTKVHGTSAPACRTLRRSI